MHFEPRSHKTPEFQVVILAGYGNKLQPLTNTQRVSEEPSPKALLPVANKPMIFYVLSWLQDAGLKDVLIISPASHRRVLSHNIGLPSDPSTASFSSLKIDIESIDDDENVSLGTADVLRKFADRIQSDFVVLPCDFIPSPTFPLSTVLNAYRADALQPLMMSLLYEHGDPIKDGPPPSLIGLDEKSKSLLFVDRQSDEDSLTLGMDLMYTCPSLRLSTQYLDSHVYIFRRTVLDLIIARKSFSSIKEDVVPFLCKLQYEKKKRGKWNSILGPTPNPQSLALEHSTTAPHNPHPGHQPPSPILTASHSESTRTSSPHITSPTRHLEDGSQDYEKRMPSLRCGYVLHKGDAARGNTLPAYTELNRRALLPGTTFPGVFSHLATASLIDPKSQISSDTIIGMQTRIGEKTTVKKSVVGGHCKIGKNVRIIGCIIMGHCEIEDGAKLENCVLGTNTKVGERAQLKDCETEPGSSIKADGMLVITLSVLFGLSVCATIALLRNRVPNHFGFSFVFFGSA